jgi:two-component system, NarL family, sensor histidine kinase UhpB
MEIHYPLNPTPIMTAATRPLNILVVEDNPADYFLFNEYLKRTGLSTNAVLHASRLKEALTILENNNPDLIFIDLALPDSDGIESFNAINSAYPNPSIIVLSGLADKQIALNTISLGAQDYLVKGSFDETLLAKSIEYSIERKKNMRNAVENYERYHSLVKATSDTVWDWDLRNDEVSWNENVKNVFGFLAGEAPATGKKYFENIHPGDRQRVVDNINACMANGNKQFNEEYRYGCKDGSYRVVVDRGYILQDDNKNPYRVIGAMMDITDRKKKEEEQTRTQVERQKLINSVTIQTQENERKEIGLELHDNINQILATAKMYVQVAIREDEVEKELLYKSYDCILKAIQEIRSISKSLILGSMKDIRLEEALLELISGMKLHTSLSIVLTIDALEAESLSAEKKLAIYRIVQEQVNNIVKHSEATKAEIDLTFSDRNVFLTIADNGIGADSAQKATGIGLHNIASRIEMQNGKLKIITGSGAGYTLKMQMPIVSYQP